MNLSSQEALALQHPELLPIEVAVLQMSADGESVEGTARLLRRSPGYVKQRRHRAFIKLGADNPAHAVALALRRKLIK